MLQALSTSQYSSWGNGFFPENFWWEHASFFKFPHKWQMFMQCSYVFLSKITYISLYFNIYIVLDTHSRLTVAHWTKMMIGEVLLCSICFMCNFLLYWATNTNIFHSHTHKILSHHKTCTTTHKTEAANAGGSSRQWAWSAVTQASSSRHDHCLSLVSYSVNYLTMHMFGSI